MGSEKQINRIKDLLKVPSHAAVDHRFYLDENGKDRRIESLSRKKRRKIKAGGRKIAEFYMRVLVDLSSSGAGYTVDQFLRQLAIEYNNRYASSGIYTQPVSFNYFEPFCKISLIEKSFAPYVKPAHEIDHLFNVTDYMDYITSLDAGEFELTELKKIPEGRVFHYTPNGDIFDFTFLNSDGREFVFAGFSIVRHGNSLYWYMVGGEVFSAKEWDDFAKDRDEVEIECIPYHKEKFLSDMIKQSGPVESSPVALEGTQTAAKTIIAGETNLETGRHLARCYMSETKSSFAITCDDPDVLFHMSDRNKKEKIIQGMHDRIESASVMWGLVEAMFQIPCYFSFRINVNASVGFCDRTKFSLKSPKGGRGITKSFRYVPSLEVSDSNDPVIRSYITPHYQIETEGYWRRLPHDSIGHDENGNSVRGKTWIKASNKWRERPESDRAIYVKSSVASARLKLKQYLDATQIIDINNMGASQDGGEEDRGVLYVLRCTLMQEQIYKVGWTSGTAKQRAKELSSATGVPVSFVVVSYWKHEDPEALEKNVHAMLSPYRVNDAREFFLVDYRKIKKIIESEIERAALLRLENEQ
ncbi:GIY-YIG nuclease family protein [Azospirillum lipoferum]|uniref:GIY-YIG nuclease family protein n=1 Tax=Azospirillum lipoferum TaxID=193 RepID=UPI0003007871|nr:GIY-YIG nuclease family protein [Azospirillum lipoferum]